MRVKLSEAEIKQIQEMVEREFPDDPALQEVHFARKVIAREAQNSGRSYLEYVRAEVTNTKKRVKRRKATK